MLDPEEEGAQAGVRDEGAVVELFGRRGGGLEEERVAEVVGIPDWARSFVVKGLLGVDDLRRRKLAGEREEEEGRTKAKSHRRSHCSKVRSRRLGSRPKTCRKSKHDFSKRGRLRTSP